MRTVVPETLDNWMGFVAVRNDLIVGLKEAERRGYNEVYGSDDEVGFFSSPLKVVLCSYLDR